MPSSSNQVFYNPWKFVLLNIFFLHFFFYFLLLETLVKRVLNTNPMIQLFFYILYLFFLCSPLDSYLTAVFQFTSQSLSYNLTHLFSFNFNTKVFHFSKFYLIPFQSTWSVFTKSCSFHMIPVSHLLSSF